MYLFQRQLDMLPNLILDRMMNSQQNIERTMEHRPPLSDFRSFSRLSPPRRRRFVPLSQSQDSNPGPATQSETSNTSNTSQM